MFDIDPVLISPVHITVAIHPADLLNMIRFAILFNSAARVWNLRLLLLWTVGILGSLIYSKLPRGVDLPTALIIAVCCLLFLHHVLGSFRWPFKGSALFDLVLILFEIAVLVAFMLYRGLLVVDRVLFIPALILLILSALFRISTITRTKESIVRQRFVFLGSCVQRHPPYTTLSILLNRSIARPLVRGEARYILFGRAMILSLIAIGVPAFAIYSIIITPLTTQIHTRDLATGSFPPTDAPPFSPNWSPPGNATILLSRLDRDLVVDPASFIIQMHVATREVVIECQPDTTSAQILSVNCPCDWAEIVNASISLLVPLNATGVYVTPVQGNLSPGWRNTIGLDSPAVPLFPGSTISGVFTWTRRDLISKTVVWGPSPRATLFTSDITGLQPTSAPTDSRVAALTLIQRTSDATRRLQDTLDSTTLSGIATLGGFWTFLNGAFALCFGANVIYFMLGRRPLSALGVVHMFQRRRLVRQWHEDFPAIHTEGGLPGSESAGIVAFIRERLVSLGEDPRATEDRSDVEAQKDGDDTPSVPPPVAPTSQPAENDLTPKYLAESEYIPDEIPLLHIDLGTDEVSDGNTK
ncbi:hypothetical protein B0H19DRAFT_1268240 [Mycena capillaripes]|nr:hypothetical protein B0H19DRAFT_1268240 [Mycena capillaripes]